MNGIQVFKNPEFGSIRTLEIDGKPYFVGKDIADMLGYSNSRRALKDHCRWVTFRYVPHPQNPEKEIGMSFIPESDIYRLIVRSKLPAAERFETWVFDEVLPSIRKSGGYIAGQEQMSDSELMAKALLVAQKQINERNAQIERMKPKEIFADAVAASHTSILIGELAKLLKQNGVETGQRRLFTWMRDNGYLIKGGSSRNMPTQKGMELGLFEIKETTINNPDGSIRISRTTKVTGKGQQYFINKFLAA